MSPLHLTHSARVWHRPFASGSAILYLISWVFPVAAGLAKDTSAFPRWWGAVDVGLAFVLAVPVMAMMLPNPGHSEARIREKTYRAYRLLIYVIPFFLAVFFLAGDRVVWINCLTGFAWRYWLLLYALPGWIRFWTANDDD